MTRGDIDAGEDPYGGGIDAWCAGLLKDIADLGTMVIKLQDNACCSALNVEMSKEADALKALFHDLQKAKRDNATMEEVKIKMDSALQNIKKTQDLLSMANGMICGMEKKKRKKKEDEPETDPTGGDKKGKKN